MTAESLSLNDTGQKLLRYLAAKYPERAMVDFLERDQIIEDNNLGDDDYNQFIAIFERCQLVSISPCQSGRYADIVHSRGGCRRSSQSTRQSAGSRLLEKGRDMVPKQVVVGAGLAIHCRSHSDRWVHFRD